jgi:hypothetical protein
MRKTQTFFKFKISSIVSGGGGAYNSVFLQSEHWRCQHFSAFVVAVEESLGVCETPSEGFHVK